MSRAIGFAIVLVLVGLFALMNWSAFAATTSLNVFVTTVEAPLGLIMLGLLAFVCVLFVVWAISLQGGLLLDARRQAKELQVQRDLADKAEASRVADLHQYLTTELSRLSQAADATRAATLARIDRLEQDQRVTLEQTGNTICAYIGELEGRLDGGAAGAARTTL